MTDSDKIPFGVWDVRNRVKKIFDEYSNGKAKIVPPTFSHTHFTFSDDRLPDDQLNVNISVQTPIEVKELVRQLYEEVSLDLKIFYSAASLAQGLGELGVNIEIVASKLLGYFNKLLKTSSINVREKWKIIDKTKKEMAELITQITKYRSEELDLKTTLKDFTKTVLYEKTRAAAFLEKVDWEHYTCPFSLLDVDSLFKTVEHIRREIEAFSLNTSAIVSALIGAISGSLITLVATNLLA